MLPPEPPGWEATVAPALLPHQAVLRAAVGRRVAEARQVQAPAGVVQERVLRHQDVLNPSLNAIKGVVAERVLADGAGVGAQRGRAQTAERAGPQVHALE